MYLHVWYFTYIQILDRIEEKGKRGTCDSTGKKGNEGKTEKKGHKEIQDSLRWRGVKVG